MGAGGSAAGGDAFGVRAPGAGVGADEAHGVKGVADSILRGGLVGADEAVFDGDAEDTEVAEGIALGIKLVGGAACPSAAVEENDDGVEGSAAGFRLEEVKVEGAFGGLFVGDDGVGGRGFGLDGCEIHEEEEGMKEDNEIGRHGGGCPCLYSNLQ